MLKGFPKIKMVEKTLSLFQDNVATALNNIQVLFKNLIPSRVVVTDAQNNLVSSEVDASVIEGLTGNIQEQLNTKIDTPSYNNFTPTVTLVGGAGNTVPQYITNIGEYIKVGSLVTIDIFLSGDGGDEGAGTGQINIALPFVAGTSQPSGGFVAGKMINSATISVVYGEIDASGTTIKLNYQNTVSSEATVTGNEQNNTTRSIRLQFSYQTDL